MTIEQDDVAPRSQLHHRGRVHCQRTSLSRLPAALKTAARRKAGCSLARIPGEVGSTPARPAVRLGNRALGSWLLLSDREAGQRLGRKPANPVAARQGRDGDAPARGPATRHRAGWRRPAPYRGPRAYRHHWGDSRQRPAIRGDKVYRAGNSSMPGRAARYRWKNATGRWTCRFDSCPPQSPSPGERVHDVAGRSGPTSWPVPRGQACREAPHVAIS